MTGVEWGVVIFSVLVIIVCAWIIGYATGQREVLEQWANDIERDTERLRRIVR